MYKCQDSDSDNYDELYPKKAFLVENVEGFDPKVDVPSNGYEYLLCVVNESKEIPSVVVADIKENSNKNCVRLPGLESGEMWDVTEFTTPKEWENHQVCEFSRIRRKIYDMRENNINFPKKYEVQAESRSEWLELINPQDKEQEPLLPYLSILMPLTDASLCVLLGYLTTCITSSEFTVNIGRWIYSLLACIQAPLFFDTCSVYRNIARKCLKIINTDLGEEEVAGLNLIICIVTHYYGQRDLISETID